MFPVNMYQAHLQEWQSGFYVPFPGQNEKTCTKAKGERGLARDMGTCITTDMETPLCYHSVELAETSRICLLWGGMFLGNDF